jgi:hypothetical protein
MLTSLNTTKSSKLPAATFLTNRSVTWVRYTCKWFTRLLSAQSTVKTKEYIHKDWKGQHIDTMSQKEASKFFLINIQEEGKNCQTSWTLNWSPQRFGSLWLPGRIRAVTHHTSGYCKLDECDWSHVPVRTVTSSCQPHPITQSEYTDFTFMSSVCKLCLSITCYVNVNIYICVWFGLRKG